MSDTARITALDLAPVDPLPDDIAVLLAKCEAKLGLVPHVLRAYAHSPDKLRAFSVMYNDLMLGESGLSKLERELIAVVVSAHNRCHYCLVAHGASLRHLSGDPAWCEAVAANYRAATLTPRQRAMLDFALQMTDAPATVEESDRQRLRDAGFSAREIWDIAAVAAFFNMSNRLATAVGMVPNPTYHTMAR